MVSALPSQPISHQPYTDESIPTTPQSELPCKLAALMALTAAELRTEWRRLYRHQPPRLSRDLLVRFIAYRMQELAYGGLSKATQRKLLSLREELRTTGDVVSDLNPRIRPGMRLVREWRGRTHTVVVTDDGFEYAGKSFSSLSKTAQAITGARWSGPRFFGLKRRQAPADQDEPVADDGVDQGAQTND